MRKKYAEGKEEIEEAAQGFWAAKRQENSSRGDTR